MSDVETYNDALRLARAALTDAANLTVAIRKTIAVLEHSQQAGVGLVANALTILRDALEGRS